MQLANLGGYSIRNEPILKVGAKSAHFWVPEEEKPELRWPIHRAIFDAKMGVLKEMVGQGLVAVNDPVIEVLVVVTQKAVSSEVTGGKNISLPEHNTHFSYIVGESIVW
jgi:hypothetical protein